MDKRYEVVYHLGIFGPFGLDIANHYDSQVLAVTHITNDDVTFYLPEYFEEPDKVNAFVTSFPALHRSEVLIALAKFAGHVHKNQKSIEELLVEANEFFR